MQTWTHDDEDQWRRWSRAALALDALVHRTTHFDQVLVLAEEPAEEEELLAVIRLFRHLAGQAVAVLAGTEHPTAAWIGRVREAGAVSAYLVSPPDGQTRQSREPRAPLDDAVEVGDDICPALHATQEQRATMSVCGRHDDRMILARHHFDAWCRASKDDCPHWRGGTGG